VFAGGHGSDLYWVILYQVTRLTHTARDQIARYQSKSPTGKLFQGDRPVQAFF